MDQFHEAFLRLKNSPRLIKIAADCATSTAKDRTSSLLITLVGGQAMRPTNDLSWMTSRWLYPIGGYDGVIANSIAEIAPFNSRVNWSFALKHV